MRRPVSVLLVVAMTTAGCATILGMEPGQLDPSVDGGTSGDTASVDAGGTPDTATVVPLTSGTYQYFGACLLAFEGGDDTKAIYFKMSLNVVAKASGGTISGTMQPLIVGATSTSQTTGGVVTIPSTEVGGDGLATLKTGTLTIPKAATPRGVDVVVESSDYATRFFSMSDACAELHGKVGAPFSLDLTSGNYCVFKQTTGAVSKVSAAAFHCP